MSLTRVIGGWEHRTVSPEGAWVVRFLPAPADEREAMEWAGIRVGKPRAHRVRVGMGWTLEELAECLGCSAERARLLDLGLAGTWEGERAVLRVLWEDLGE